MPPRQRRTKSLPLPPPRECFVYVQMPQSMDVVTCGRYVYRPTLAGPSGAFRYGRTYLDRRNAVPLDDIELPLEDRTYISTRSDGMFGALRDASPDAWGRLVIQDAMGRTDLDEMDYLLEAPEDRAGALTFGRGQAPPPPIRSFNRVLRLTDLLQAAEVIERGSESPADTRMQQARLLLEQPGSLMGGARPKNVVEDEGSLWLAKFPSREDTWNSAVVEAGLLALAEDCGIRTPRTRVVGVGDRSVLLVRRFDRDANPAGDGGYWRHRLLSGLTLLDGDEGVIDRSGWSYLLLAAELQRRSERPGVDRLELFRRMVYNALVSNTDDHPRNHALVAPTAAWHLAPAFDITPAPTPGQHERFLAMVAGPHGRLARRVNLIAGAPQFGLSTSEAEAIVDQMTDTVRASWERALRHQGATSADIAQVAPAFLNEGFWYDIPDADIRQIR